MSQACKALFFTFLLAFLACQACFYLLDLTVDLLVGKAEFMGKKVAIGFSKYFLQEEQISFLNCQTVDNSSPVFSSFG